ncbi:ABC-2 type transporter family protein [Mycobacterium ulcerans str. Harvey]|uniref:ABC-2 type transporter family protein n=1 Tax=Mycobacterium ulcerans str. Harvey TaxID=1299332 RepID=A0ABN0R308_MYCUL|nr:ABC-2 type transporter family protein [Mycobacterium ulcerans str. Harvey]
MTGQPRNWHCDSPAIVGWPSIKAATACSLTERGWRPSTSVTASRSPSAIPTMERRCASRSPLPPERDRYLPIRHEARGIRRRVPPGPSPPRRSPSPEQTDGVGHPATSHRIGDPTNRHATAGTVDVRAGDPANPVGTPGRTRGPSPMPPHPPAPPSPPRPPSQSSPTPPTPELPAASAPAASEGEEQPKSRGLVERMIDATRKLLPGRAETDSASASDSDSDSDSGSSTGTGELPSTNRLPLKPGARTIGVAAYQLGLTVDGHELISDVSFTTRPGSLIAVVGPSRARNSSLAGLLARTRPLSDGVLTVDGHDVAAEPESMRSRIGVVTRDNRVHPRLTVEQALSYAARMRLPPDTSADNRRRVVNQVLDEVELTAQRATRVAKLTPDERRCAAMAIELITRPSLLVVDEPSAGLNPAQEMHVLAMLRRQADLGYVVVVASMPLAHLNMCDQVLLLTPAGTLAFAGPPVQIESTMGTASWPDIFARVSADPQAAHQSFQNRLRASVSPTPPSVLEPERRPAELTFGAQVRLILRRQVRVFLASRLYFVFLTLLPFALGALTLLIPGDAGLDRPPPGSGNPHEAVEILAALNFAAVLMGTALTVRDLVSERQIFRREQAVGLSASTYLIGKIIMFGLVAAVQAAILTAIVLLIKGQPVHGTALLPNPGVEIYASVAATTIVSAIIGLTLSTLGSSLREVLPLVVPVILASLLFAGGLVPLVGTWGFDQIAWFVPAHWGFAATASTVNLHRVDVLATHNEVWAHYAGWWAFDIGMLVTFGVVAAGLARYRLRAPGVPADHGIAHSRS